HAFARLLHHPGLGEDLGGLAVGAGPEVADAHGAARLRLWRTALYLDQAHAAIAGDRQPLMEAEARDLRARGLAYLEERVLRRYVDLDAVDFDFGHALSVPRDRVRPSLPALRHDASNHRSRGAIHCDGCRRG